MNEPRQEDKVAHEEANVFAALLLMPRGMFEDAMKGVDLLDDKELRPVAKLFQVSVAMVLYRVEVARKLARKGVRSW